MDFSERAERINGLVARAVNSEFRSRKRLHKLVYLLQLKGIDFGQSFGFLHYGVFSQTLAADLTSCKSIGLISETQNTSGEYTLSSGSLNPTALSFDNPQQEEFLTLAMSKSARFLEAVSTIAYLTNLGYGADRLRSKFVELKPGLVDVFDEAHVFAVTYDFAKNS